MTSLLFCNTFFFSNNNLQFTITLNIYRQQKFLFWKRIAGELYYCREVRVTEPSQPRSTSISDGSHPLITDLTNFTIIVVSLSINTQSMYYNNIEIRHLKSINLCKKELRMKCISLLPPFSILRISWLVSWPGWLHCVADPDPALLSSTVVHRRSPRRPGTRPRPSCWCPAPRPRPAGPLWWSWSEIACPGRDSADRSTEIDETGISI